MDKLNVNNDEFIIKDGYLETVFLCDKRIVIPDGVSVIGSLAFDIMNEGNGVSRYFDRGCIEEVLLPDSLEIIETGAFRHCNLKSIRLPENLKKIGRGAFATNSNLEKIELNDNIEEVESYAFSTKMEVKSKLFQGHVFDKNHYITDIPSEFIINYTDYEKLDRLIDLLKNSGSFGSNTYKFRMFRVPKFEFILVGPRLSKSENLKIYKKLLLLKCKKVSFINNNEKIELPGIEEENIEIMEQDEMNNSKIVQEQNLVNDEDISEGKSR